MRAPLPGSKPGAPGGVVVGTWRDRRRDHWLYDTSERHVLAFAPSGTGKTTCLVVPTLLSWPDSVIVLDIKSELWRLTSGYRESVLRNVCLRFDPTCVDGTAARYNPLFAIPRSEEDVANAQSLADKLIDLEKGGGDNHFFREAAHSLLVGVLLHVLYAEDAGEKTLAGCAQFLAHPDRKLRQMTERMLTAHHDPDQTFGWKLAGRATPTHPVVSQAAASLRNMDARTAGGVVPEALNALSIFRDPIVARNTSTSDFTAADLVVPERPVSLYLTIPPGELGRLHGVLRIVLSQLVRELTHPSREAERQPRLLLLLDEFTALGRLDFLHRAVAYLRSFGIRVFISIQTLSQLYEVYGQHQSISSNCGTQIAYGANDAATAKLLSDMTGVFTVQFDQRSVSGSGLGGRRATDSRGHASRPLLTPDEVRRLPADQSIVFVAGHQPIRGTRTPYFRDRELAARAGLVPAKGEADRLSHDWSTWTRWSANIPARPTFGGKAPGPKNAAPPGVGLVYRDAPEASADDSEPADPLSDPPDDWPADDPEDDPQ